MKYESIQTLPEITKPEGPKVEDQKKETEKQMENPEGKKDKKENTTEDRIDKVDEIFDELLDSVKDAPESKKEALKILIGQMRQIGDQMKQVRDVKQLQEMKKLMLQNWDELNKLTEGNPELLNAIQGWGKKFIEEKVIYYELIGDVKDELIDNSQKVQEDWDDMLVGIGRVAGIAHVSDLKVRTCLANPGSLDEHLDVILGNFTSGMAKFIAGATDPESHYSYENLETDEINAFIDRVGQLIIVLASALEDKISVKDDDRKEGREILNNLVATKKKMSESVKNVSKIFRVIKKVRDTHFLPLYNEKPEEAS